MIKQNKIILALDTDDLNKALSVVKSIDANIIFISREIACTSPLTGRSGSSAGQCGAKGLTRERSEGSSATTSWRYQARMTKQRTDPQRYVP